MKNGFIKKSIGTLTLGEKLRKLRLEKRITLADASRNTRVKPEYLDYLEDGKYEKLPPDVYVKGFLRSYANFLGADEENLIKLYEKERGIRINLDNKDKKKEKMHRIEPLNISSFVFTPKKFFVSLLILLAVGGFFYIYREVDSFSNAPRLIILSPEPNAQLDSDSIDVEGMTERDAKLSINDKPVLVGDDGRFKERLTLQSGNNILNIKAVNKFGKEAVQALTVQASLPEQEENYPMPESQSGADVAAEENQKSQTIELEVRVESGPVWVSVETDGNLVFSGSMLEGASQLFSAQEKITLNSERAKATFIKFNGNDMGPLGKGNGSAKDVIFTKDTKIIN